MAICEATRSTAAIGYGCRRTDSERSPVRMSTNWPARAPAAIDGASNPSSSWPGRTWRIQRRTVDGPGSVPRGDRDGSAGSAGSAGGGRVLVWIVGLLVVHAFVGSVGCRFGLVV